MDLVVVGLETVGERRVVTEPLVTTQLGLPALCDVVVFVNRRPVVEQDKFVGMPTITEINGGFCPHHLLPQNQPVLGTFPGIEITVEPVGPKWAVTRRQQQVGIAKCGFESRLRGELSAPVVPVRRESWGKVSISRDRFGPLPKDVGYQDVNGFPRRPEAFLRIPYRQRITPCSSSTAPL